MFISSAWAQAAGGSESAFGAFLPLILIFIVFYFLLIRPQQKKQKAQQAKLGAVRRGDKILTAGGIYGSVIKVINEKEIQVEIAENTRVRIATGTLLDVLTKPEPANDTGKTEKKSLLGSIFGGLKNNTGKPAVAAGKPKPANAAEKTKPANAAEKTKPAAAKKSKSRKPKNKSEDKASDSSDDKK